ncbi:MAG TPA: EF-P lysine aminoacylase EpmA [Stellaceae bacterium]|jgi:lysyl-tRNA synthetase class 2|nr:EF-P lysine aminoacylase EpmA [Stellaceae bacterium]
MEQWWRPERFALRRERLEKRVRMLAVVRGFFAGEGFVEVDTPALQVSPGLEPHLRAFSTDLHDPGDGRTVRRYLHTSPEFAMKKLLAAGMPRIWQLAHVFRDGERSATHHPEFSMLEWYRAGATWRDLVLDCVGLVRACQAAAHSPSPSGPGSIRPSTDRWNGAIEREEGLVWRARSADAREPWREISVAEAFREYCRIDILATAPNPLNPDLELLAPEARRIGIEPHAGDDWDTLYFRIFLDRIEPFLGIGAPTILYDFPAAMAALSRRNRADPRLAERFELYVCGLELANAFGELTDPAEQRARFLADQARKQALYGETYPIDDDFLAALAYLPSDCAGIALGFDRLVMLATAAADIEDVLWAPVR